MNSKELKTQNARHALGSTLFAIGYGIAALGFLVAIERVDWVHIKPATGTAAALYEASDHADHAKAGSRVTS